MWIRDIGQNDADFFGLDKIPDIPAELLVQRFFKGCLKLRIDAVPQRWVAFLGSIPGRT